MIKNSIMASMVILFLLLPITFLGCSGGGGDSSAPARPTSTSIEVLPSAYNFGPVTPGNSSAPFELQISNEGSAVLNVSDIELTDTTNYTLDLSGGSNPCNSASPTLAVGGNCTVEVDFLPQSTDYFPANLTIRSNDPGLPTVNVPLSGSQEEIDELNVRINHVYTNCPASDFAAYVSVTDQGGYPVVTLAKNNFLITENGGSSGAPIDAPFISNADTLSVALVMDYSGSITNIQDAVEDMEESVANFVDNMRTDDEAEIIKFNSIVTVVQDFTSDKDDLIDAIAAPYSGLGTNLYDAVVKAVNDTAVMSKVRKVVIVVTDGNDDNSLQTLNDVISNANNEGIPVFTVGLGNLDTAILQQMADDTGGQFYQAATSDNLRTIYQQLADLLFYDQYILTYNSGLAAGLADLTIEAELAAAIPGSDTKEIEITTCP